MTPSRRTFLTGLSASIIAAPAIVRFASLMPVRGIIQATPEDIYKLLAERILAAQNSMIASLIDNLYGDRFAKQFWHDEAMKVQTYDYKEVLAGYEIKL